MRRVTGSPWIADFRIWTWPEVAILGADQKEHGLLGREWCTCLTKPAFWLPVSFSHLISVSPNWQRHAAKKVRSFIPCHFIIDRILREICESQTSVISVPDLALEDSAIYSARVLENIKWRPARVITLNGCEGSLWGGALSSQAWRMLYKPPGAVYRASYKEPLDQSDSWKLIDQLWNCTKLYYCDLPTHSFAVLIWSRELMCCLKPN